MDVIGNDNQKSAQCQLGEKEVDKLTHRYPTPPIALETAINIPLVCSLSDANAKATITIEATI